MEKAHGAINLFSMFGIFPNFDLDPIRGTPAFRGRTRGYPLILVTSPPTTTIMMVMTMEPKDFHSIDRGAPASVLAMRWLDNGQTLVEHKCATLTEAWQEIIRFKENGDVVVAIKVDGNVIEPQYFDRRRKDGMDAGLLQRHRNAPSLWC